MFVKAEARLSLGSTELSVKKKKKGSSLIVGDTCLCSLGNQKTMTPSVYLSKTGTDFKIQLSGGLWDLNWFMDLDQFSNRLVLFM